MGEKRTFVVLPRKHAFLEAFAPLHSLPYPDAENAYHGDLMRSGFSHPGLFDRMMPNYTLSRGYADNPEFTPWVFSSHDACHRH